MTVAVGRYEVEQFRALVADRLGLFFDDSKLGLLAETLRRRIEANHDAGVPYLDRLAARHLPPEELGQLAQELTVTETYFYRGPDQIRAFIELALPQCLAASAGMRKVRVLSAGCASGDEPYSLAIAIREQLVEAADRVSITAVDVNPAMLEKARRACYSTWSLRELPPPLRPRWFRTEGASFILDDAVRRAVAFEKCNLAHDDSDLWTLPSWDIVFCRNVLMYFDPTLARAVVARFARALARDGYLFLGHAETLRGLSNNFHLCHTHGTFYYQLKDGALEQDIAAPFQDRINWAAPPRFDDTATWVDTVRRAAERIDALAETSNQLASPPVVSPPVQPAPDLARTLELLKSERYDQALMQLSTLSAEQAREPEVLLLRAVSLAHSGALAQAEQVCRELLERDELNAGAHYVLALCREGLGNLAGAVEEDQTAVYLDSGFAMARLHLGILARRRGERELAHRELSQALTLLQQEDASRLLLFGGGFSREALGALCRGELKKCGEPA
ncbi:MAG: protein-glutamate O-methyltransferase [Betaproteobacteria bacterium]|nr:protein-glutamate O-methyltransferase [Betaproteobacteria bacterium]